MRIWNKIGIAGCIAAWAHGTVAMAQDATNAMHPDFNLLPMRPQGFEPRVSGLGFLSDGSLAMAMWDGYEKKMGGLKNGKVFIVRGTETGDPSKITVTTFADGLFEPMGLAVLHDTIYVATRDALLKLPDRNGDGKADAKEVVCKGWNLGGTAANNWFDLKNYDDMEWLFGLTYTKGAFYSVVGARYPASADQGPDRGGIIRMSLDGKWEIISGGIRRGNGVGIGPDGEVFVTDNQGEWLPANKLIHVLPGKFYGCRQQPATRFMALPETPPVVWLPQGELSNSPTGPIVLTDGPYKAQMLIGDITQNGLMRVFLEKVGETYQGAAFKFTTGFESAINRLAEGPDGDIYLGGLGEDHFTNGWAWNGRKFGFQKMKMKSGGTRAFEMLAIRSLDRNTMEIEFSEEVGSQVGNTESYYVDQWWYHPTDGYGGPKMDQNRLAVVSATPQPGGRKVVLKINGLQEKHVVHVRLQNLVSKSGKSPWTREGWYTLNAFGPGTEAKAVSVQSATSPVKSLTPTAVLLGNGCLRIEGFTGGSATLVLRDLRGSLLSSIAISHSGVLDLKSRGLQPGLYAISIMRGESTAATLLVPIP